MNDKLLESILNFVLNNMGNREMMHLNHYIESRAEFWQEIQKLKADRAVLVDHLKIIEGMRRRDGNDNEYEGADCLTARQALKSIGEIE